MAVNLVGALRDEFSIAVHAVRGIDQRDAAGRAMATQLAADGVTVSGGLRLTMSQGGLITSAWALARAVRRFDPDILHLHTEIPEAAGAIMRAARLTSRRAAIVRTVHSPVWWDFAPPLARWCDRNLVGAGAIDVGVSAAAAAAPKALHARSGANTHPPARVIFNGMPQPATRPERSAPGSTFRVIMGGRWLAQKGTDLLPEILRQTVLPPGRRAHLDLYGHGEHAARLQMLAESPPPGWTLRLHAPVDDFAARLAAADLLLMPSRYEGLPLVAIESIWAGTPVVLTDAAGCREVMPGAHPWWAQAGDAASFAAVLSSALRAENHWPRIADAARAFAETRFTMAAMATGYADLYRTLTNASRQ